ncbi:hypothetical protein [Proteus phage vB_PmiP_RS1pmA]|uniref:Uncharacterized protein n=1 Tax=Proteus phage vB_PmiP_RS1pmA TaxID=2250312 RepID=A0A514CY56_9CAUD|nr:hypothetical protein [Proteus phage vB_PmiP_RS1pmA]
MHYKPCKYSSGYISKYSTNNSTKHPSPFPFVIPRNDPMGGKEAWLG